MTTLALFVNVIVVFFFVFFGNSEIFFLYLFSQWFSALFFQDEATQTMTMYGYTEAVITSMFPCKTLNNCKLSNFKK